MPIQTGQLIPSNFTNIGPDTVIPVGTGLSIINDYAQKVLTLNSATGGTATLPAAIGSGVKFYFLQTAAAPSAPHIIKVASATDFFIGNIETVDAAAVTGYIAANSATIATNSDTISLSATTTGGLSAGSWIEVQDVAAATWSVRGITSSSGTAATPFSATV